MNLLSYSHHREADKLASGCLTAFLESWDLSPDLSEGLVLPPPPPCCYFASPGKLNINSCCLRLSVVLKAVL